MPVLDPDDLLPGHSWPDPKHPGEYLYFGYEAETDMSGDGSGDPDTHYLTIAYPDAEELAVICHRANEQFPIDGESAVLKELTAAWVVRALNAFDEPHPMIEDARAEIRRRVEQPVPLSTFIKGLADYQEQGGVSTAAFRRETRHVLLSTLRTTIEMDGLPMPMVLETGSSTRGRPWYRLTWADRPDLVLRVDNRGIWRLFDSEKPRAVRGISLAPLFP